MKIARTFFVAGANPDSPLARGGDGQYPDFTTATEDSIIRSQDRLVVVDINENAKKLIQKFGLKPSQCYLIRQEPAVVCPANYSEFALGQFSKIIDVGRDSAGATLSVPWPQDFPKRPAKFLTSATRITARPVLMNANKLSLVSGELYSLRRKVIHAEDIALYGPKWDSGFVTRIRTLAGETQIFSKSKSTFSRTSLSKWFDRHPNYMGLAGDKLEIYAKYKVAVVIENSPEYMSEKLLDAIFAGCIPVYVGPPIEKFGLPKDLVVESAPNLVALSDAIARAKVTDYAAWLAKALDYLENPSTFSYWSPGRIFAEVSNHIFHR